jgi:hypothetical protein
MRRFYVKRQLEELKALERCENKDTRVYREAAEYRDRILASVAETGIACLDGIFELSI